MNVLTSHPEALADAFMTIIWWTNGIVGSLFALEWAVRRYSPRVEAWITRQREICANRVAGEHARDGSNRALSPWMSAPAVDATEGA